MRTCLPCQRRRSAGLVQLVVCVVLGLAVWHVMNWASRDIAVYPSHHLGTAHQSSHVEAESDSVSTTDGRAPTRPPTTLESTSVQQSSPHHHVLDDNARVGVGHPTAGSDFLDRVDVLPSRLAWAERLFNRAVESRFVPGTWASMNQSSSGVGREVISIDESGPMKYYESRDLMAWSIVLGTRGFKLHDSWPLPVDTQTLQTNPRLAMVLCMSMVVTDTRCIAPSVIHSFPPSFRVNQVPGLRNVLWRKDSYCKTINDAVQGASRALGDWIRPELLRHVIQCWRFPEQATELQRYFDNGGAMVIVKPTTRGEGRGIYTANRLSDIATEARDQSQGVGRVVQTMVMRPALVQGRKFDLRCYVLITSIQPLRLYMWDDGLVRLAAAPYNVSDIHGSDNRQSWMTNTFVNKAYANVNNLTISFRRLSNELRNQGIGVRQVWQGVREAIVHSFLLGETAMARYIHATMAGRPCLQCFQLLGVDVLLDENMVASVIEVNGIPSMQLGHNKEDPIDTTHRYTRMKLQLLHTAVDMLTLNCSLPSTNTMRQALANMLGGTRSDEQPTDHVALTTQRKLDYLAAAVCEHHHNHGFTRIFPAANQHQNGLYPQGRSAFINWSGAAVHGLARDADARLLTNADVINDLLPILDSLN
eukprot:m.67694 g.67694  ORF g.67694 m.67694 type:complete len:646 (-) comp8458_c0_seq1:39-1976(-)